MSDSWHKWVLATILGLAVAGAVAAIVFGNFGFIFVPIIIGPFWRFFRRDGGPQPPGGGPIHPS